MVAFHGPEPTTCSVTWPVSRANPSPEDGHPLETSGPGLGRAGVVLMMKLPPSQFHFTRHCTAEGEIVSGPTSMLAFPVTTFTCSQRGAARVGSLLETMGGAVL